MLGKRIPQILRNAGATVEIFSDHFPQSKPDVEWLAEVSERGWVVLTKDINISSDEAEQATVAQARAKVFMLASGNAVIHEIERDLENIVIRMERFASSQPAPFIAKIYPYSKIQDVAGP